ncbi:glycosyltransferase family 2 protein [Falsirhodobacter sp. 20TX0035]|uniref:glycosyltransferase family 2 protein n=1 Tax=Falsirhodobacter sp. 20TX0035 TaxID=3022019 RepID=UPI00232AEC44|nr:glycosyltransferase family 2 protein [Falsirhodobacter sp. 20TX0035]MDB6454576.1 glycosyltransferase family 2 protein [Falsirhodobacter sp. 20TX0035]
MDWGICITARAPEDQLRAFLAHHLGLGAAHVWLHLDDPDDPAADRLRGLDRVTVIRCDDAWWGKRRPDRHQNRQSRNIRRLYDAAPLPWIAHLDVDEFMRPERPVAEVLAGTDAIMVRMRPWEALHDPDLSPDIFTARSFRAPLRDLEQRIAAFGDFAPAMASGALSHIVGKAIFRTGVPGLEPRLHGGFLNKERITGIGFTDDLPLLHFHAQDREAWLERLPFRLERGAYTNNAPLNDFLSTAGPDRVRAFYDAVMAPPAHILDRLREDGLLIDADLDLPRKAAAL